MCLFLMVPVFVLTIIGINVAEMPLLEWWCMMGLLCVSTGFLVTEMLRLWTKWSQEAEKDGAVDLSYVGDEEDKLPIKISFTDTSKWSLEQWGYCAEADSWEAIGDALSKATGCPNTYVVEGNKLTFTIDGGDRQSSVGGFAGGETKGEVTFDTPILLYPSVRMISGVDPLGGKVWKDLLYSLQEAKLTDECNARLDAAERLDHLAWEHDAEREERK